MPSKNKLLKQKEKEEAKEKENQEKLMDEYWSEGIDKKGEKKAQLLHEKQMERMKKNKDKQDLLDLDEEANKNISGKATKNKNKKGGDFYLLNQALSLAPKTKGQKEAEKKALEKKKHQERLEKEQIAKQEKERLEEIERIKNSKKGINYDHQDIMNTEINNTLEEGETFTTGIDNILSTLNNNDQDEKYSFQTFYNDQLAILKIDLPGLRLSQYKEKIFNLWKKDPRNPKNQIL